LGVVA
jgi:hypothetical protein